MGTVGGWVTTGVSNISTAYGLEGRSSGRLPTLSSSVVRYGTVPACVLEAINHERVNRFYLLNGTWEEYKRSVLGERVVVEQVPWTPVR